MADSLIAEAKLIHRPWTKGELPDGWSWSRLDDVCEGVFDCPHSTPKLSDRGPLVVRTQDILTGVFRAEQAAHVSEETYRERTVRAIPSQGDLLYSREGTYFGNAAEVPANTLVCLGQRMVLIRPRATQVYFRYLRYWLNSPMMSAYIHGFRDGSVAERLNLPTIRALPVLIPPLPDQRAIAHVLGTLDDKIELNRRMNRTLEELAATIFRAWFVDFEPVRAKAAGRQPEGMDAATAASFPDRLVESGLGEIPEGWARSTLTMFVDVLSGGTPSTKNPDYWNGSIKWYAVVDAPTDSDVFVIRTARTLTEQGLNSCAAQILPIGTTIISARGTVGKLALTPEPMAMNQSCYGLAPTKQDTEFFVYFSVRHLVDTLQQRSHGSIFDTITRATLDTVDIIIPSLEILAAYHMTVSPLMKRILLHLEQKETLIELRDTLLPRLLSGELRVPEEMLTT